MKYLYPMLSLALVGCTPSQVKSADTAIAAADLACKGLLALEGAPEFAPLCATAEEVGDAVVEAVHERYSAANTDAERVAALTYHVPKAEQHRRVARKRARKP
jgi:hypothetical protein